MEDDTTLFLIKNPSFIISIHVLRMEDDKQVDNIGD